MLLRNSAEFCACTMVVPRISQFPATVLTCHQNQRNITMQHCVHNCAAWPAELPAAGIDLECGAPYSPPRFLDVAITRRTHFHSVCRIRNVRKESCSCWPLVSVLPTCCDIAVVGLVGLECRVQAKRACLSAAFRRPQSTHPI